MQQACLFLGVVIVAAGQQMAKDELGYIDFLLLVHFDRHTVSIVPHLDCAALLHRTSLGSKYGVEGYMYIWSYTAASFPKSCFDSGAHEEPQAPCQYRVTQKDVGLGFLETLNQKRKP